MSLKQHWPPHKCQHERRSRWDMFPACRNGICLGVAAGRSIGATSKDRDFPPLTGMCQWHLACTPHAQELQSPRPVPISSSGNRDGETVPMLPVAMPNGTAPVTAAMAARTVLAAASAPRAAVAASAILTPGTASVRGRFAILTPDPPMVAAAAAPRELRMLQ